MDIGFKRGNLVINADDEFLWWKICRTYFSQEFYAIESFFFFFVFLDIWLHNSQTICSLGLGATFQMSDEVRVDHISLLTRIFDRI